MSAQAKPARASQRHSTGSQLDVPMSVFNQDLLKFDKITSENSHKPSSSRVNTNESRSSKRAVGHISPRFRETFSFSSMNKRGICLGLPNLDVVTNSIKEPPQQSCFY